MKTLTFILLLATGTLAGRAQTDVPPVRSVALLDCIQDALTHNLDLQIERFNPVASRYGIAEAQGRYDPLFRISGEHQRSTSAGSDFDLDTGFIIPGPTRKTDQIESSLGGLLPWGLSYSFFGDFAETRRESGSNTFRSAPGQIGFSLAQPLLKNFLIDNTRLRIQVARVGLKFSQAGLRLRMIGVITDVEKAYYDLIAARETVKVREKAVELAERSLSENQKRVAAGSLAPLDEKQAESQAATAQADLVSARRALAAQQNVLKLLMTDNYAELHKVDLEPTEALVTSAQSLDTQESWRRGLIWRADLQQEKFNLEQAGIQLKYDRNQLLPQLDIVGSHDYSAGGVGVDSFDDAFRSFRHRELPGYSYGAVLSIPLSNRSAKNRYKTSQTAVQQSLLEVKKLEQQILAEIDDAITLAKASYERVDSTHKASVYAETALEAEQKKLESGKSTSFNVLQLQRDLTDARSREITARSDYSKSLNEIARAEGTTLQRRAVEVELK